MTGTSTPGQPLTIAATNVDEDIATTLTSMTVGASGAFSLAVALIGGPRC